VLPIGPQTLRTAVLELGCVPKPDEDGSAGQGLKKCGKEPRDEGISAERTG
jgi:hypothetical protein